MSNNPYPKVFKPFESLLNKRFERFDNKKCTNEDCIRNLFCTTLFSELQISPNEIILECPMSESDGERKRVDLYVLPTSERDGVVVEFKYDRRLNENQKKNRLRQAGQLFADINRLTQFKKEDKVIRRYFVYVTDEYMWNYLKDNKKLNRFIVAEGGDIPHKELCELPKTFREAACKENPEKVIERGTVITIVYDAKLSGTEHSKCHKLRIYQISLEN